MMLFLALYISLDFVDKVFAYRKGTICSLPFEKFSRGDLMGNQVGRSSFDFLNQICHSDRRWKADEQMDMV